MLVCLPGHVIIIGDDWCVRVFVSMVVSNGINY